MPYHTSRASGGKRIPPRFGRLLASKRSSFRLCSRDYHFPTCSLLDLHSLLTFLFSCQAWGRLIISKFWFWTPLKCLQSIGILLVFSDPLMVMNSHPGLSLEPHLPLFCDEVDSYMGVGRESFRFFVNWNILILAKSSTWIHLGSWMDWIFTLTWAPFTGVEFCISVQATSLSALHLQRGRRSGAPAGFQPSWQGKYRECSFFCNCRFPLKGIIAFATDLFLHFVINCPVSVLPSEWKCHLWAWRATTQMLGESRQD